ncbi:MAG: outer rane assembly protein [Rickettsiaceae bacterium]|jgi:hypothetical protein|nr:outer rane assembly protein [Rickettsiaceae bacterium]
MNKLVRLSILIIFSAAALLIAIPLFINTAPLKLELEKKISAELKANFQIVGKTNISFLPLPQIALSNVKIKNLVNDEYLIDAEIKRIIIKPNFFSLFGKQTKIGSLIFESPTIENKYNGVEIANQATPGEVPSGSNNLSDQIFGFGKNGAKVADFKNIETIKVKKGYFIERSNNDTAVEFSKINFLLKNNLKKQVFTIKGDFLSGEVPTNFSLVADANNDSDSSLKIQSPIFNLAAKGKFSNSNISDLLKSNFVGNIDINIVDLRAFFNKYISQNNFFYRNINPTQPLKISADINNQQGKLEVKNIVLSSPSINGKGKIHADISALKPDANIELEFEQINIDDIWLRTANSSAETKGAEDKIVQQFSDKNPTPSDQEKTYILENQNPSDTKPLFDNLNLAAKIKIKTAIYYGKNLNNIDVNFATLTDGNFSLNSFKSDIPGQGNLQISGTFQKENNIPKFSGSLAIEGKKLEEFLAWLKIQPQNLKAGTLADYNFTSALLSLPNFTVFKNFNLAINGGKNIVGGNFQIDNSSDIPVKTTDLKINYLNYDDYFSSEKSQYLSSGSLLKKLLWLNTANYKYEISLLIDQLIYKENYLQNQSFKVKYGQGYLKFLDISFFSPGLDLKGNIELDISTNNPKLNIDISSNNFYYKNQKEGEVIEQFFNLPSLAEFSGQININIGNLLVNQWQGRNIKIAGDLKDGIVTFKNFSLDSYGGQAKYNGSMVFKEAKTITGSIELVGANNNQFLYHLFGIQNIYGLTNLSAVVNSTASNKTEFIKNLDASGKFITGNVLVKGFGIYDLAEKMTQRAQAENMLAVLYNPNSVSQFEKGAGAFIVRKNSSKNQFNIKVSSVGINGIISGDVDMENDRTDGKANFVFISGTRQSQVPINIAVNFKGRPGAIEESTNLDQVKQYLNSSN